MDGSCGDVMGFVDDEEESLYVEDEGKGESEELDGVSRFELGR